MKIKIELTEDTINEIMRKELERVMTDHPPTHPTTEAARHLLWYYATTKYAKAAIKRIRKNRREVYK